MSQHKALYNTAAWKRRRAAQLGAEPLCRMHLALGQTVAATVADHVQPHRGDHELFFHGQLQSLCAPCHSAHKQAQEHSASGLVRGAGLEGRPLDLAHPWYATPQAGGGEKSSAPELKTGRLPLSATAQNSEGGA